MRAVIQRVSQSSVVIGGICHGEIGTGLNILIGITEGDSEEDIDWLCHKIVNLRVFDDEDGIMNRSVLDVDGDILVISQFTLFASTKKGTDLPTQRRQSQIFPSPCTKNFWKGWKIFWESPLKKVSLVQIWK